MANSPPLSLIYLAPLPDPKRPPRRPGSVASANSTTPTWTSVISQPPSSYNRRSRSAELYKALSLLAPAAEKAEISWADSSPGAETGTFIPAGSIPIVSMTTAQPNPPKKPGFFRRLSLSTSQSQPQARVQPSVNGSGAKHLSRNGSTNDPFAGPAYESIPAGAAPSALAGRNGGRMGSNGPVVFPNKKVGERPVQPRADSSATPIAASFAKPRSPDTTSPRMKVRNPIHPALASPPNSPPRRTSMSSSPYDPAVQASTSRMTNNHVSPAPRGIPTDGGGQHYHQRAGPSSPPTTRNAVPARPEHRPPPLSQSAYAESAPPARPLNTARPTPPPLAIPSDPLKPNNMRSVSQPNPARYSRFEDADGLPERPPLPPGAQPSAVSNLKQAEPRGVVSARRSTSSSRRSPLAKVEKAPGLDQRGHPGVRRVATTSASSPTAPSKSPTVSPTATAKVARNGESVQLSEASAYAKSVAATISTSRPPHASPPRAEAKLSPSSPPPPAARTPRPLPNPPPGPSRSASGAQFVVIASSPKSPPKQDKPSTTKTSEQQSPSPNRTPKPHLLIDPVANKRVSSQPLNFDFPRSPTLPPLVDPRTAKDNRSDPIAQWGNTRSPSPLSPKSPPLPSSQLPLRVSSAQSRRVVSSPLASPSITSNGWKSPTPGSGQPQPVMERRHPTGYLKNRSRASLTYILSYTRIQATLLPYLSINSFLSLTGASDVIRKRFTGETVGRWVMKEWGIQVDREKGRSWPNLTVWEGFSFPSPPPLPFEDDFVMSAPSLPFSNSMNSLGSQRPRSRLGSAAGSDAGSVTPSTKMPRQERLIEIVMPEPLAPQSAKSDEPQSLPINHKARRRGSIGSLASATSLHFGRRRSASITTESNVELSSSTVAAPMASGKAALPPVSYPSAKRYGFKRHGEPTRSRTSSDSGRPGSIFSVQSSPSLSSAYQRGSGMFNGRGSFAVDRNAPPVPGFPAGLPMPPPIGGGPRSSFASSDAGRSSRRSDHGGGFSPINGTGFSRRDLRTPPPSRPEPSFERPIPLTLGRVPILRVFVPLSESVRRWPSAEGAAAAVKELEKCGALRRMQAGDLVVNTAIRAPKTTEHVLIYAPNVRHLLIPLDYTFSPTGHLPIYINGLDVPPSYYYPFLPTPQVLFLDLAPFGQQALQSLRLAYDRRDVTVASGARLSAKRYLHVAGFEIKPTDRVAQEWCGTVSLEAEGTAEGKADLEQRLVGSQGARPLVGPWELVREKSMTGTIWLRLLKEKDPQEQ
ncbi:hypothetical protein IAU59_002412 [Kwoniella sp. CBS 9459]